MRWLTVVLLPSAVFTLVSKQSENGVLYQEFNNTAFAGSVNVHVVPLFEDMLELLSPWSTVRVQASIVPPEQAWLRFGLLSNAGYARLWVDHHLVLDSWMNDEQDTQYANYSLPVPFVPRNASLLQLELTFHDRVPSVLQLMANSSMLNKKWLLPEISPLEQMYMEQRRVNERGWNTWLSTDMLTHTLLPHGLSLSLKVGYVSMVAGPSCSRKDFPVKHGIKDLHGAYTEIEEIYDGNNVLRLESATFGTNGLIIRLSPVHMVKRSVVQVQLHVPNDYVPRTCRIDYDGDSEHIRAMCHGFDDVSVSFDGLQLRNHSKSPGTVVQNKRFLLDDREPLFVYVTPTGDKPPNCTRTAHLIVDRARKELLRSFGSSSVQIETRAGLIASIAWNKIYTPYEGIITPILRGRSWSQTAPHAYVLFEWDTYLAAMIAAHIGDVWVATSNIVRMTQSLWYQGFVPGFWNGKCGELDKSKPPLGIMALAFLLERHPEQDWLIEYLLSHFLLWNEWWTHARMPRSDHLLIAPGSSRSNVNDKSLVINCDNNDPRFASACETGLDNSPLYDSAVFVNGKDVIDQWDVGMSALWIFDSKVLANFSLSLGRSSEGKRLLAQSRLAVESLQSELWNENIGIYMNKKWTDGNWIDPDPESNSPPIAPTSFYPMLTRVPSDDQALTMILGHLVNSSEFGVDEESMYGIPSISRLSSAAQDNSYWRGRVWGPMNWRVYLGLKEYSSRLPAAQFALERVVAQSSAVFLSEWTANRRIMENYNSATGEGCDVRNAVPFYHWGALTALIADLEVAVSKCRQRTGVCTNKDNSTFSIV